MAGPPEPGPQQRRRTGERWALLVYLGLFIAALLIAAAVFASKGFGGEESERGTNLAIAGICLGIGVVFAPLAYLLLRKLRPRKAAGVALDVPRTTVRRGEELTATLRLVEPSKVRGALTIAVRCVALHDVEAPLGSQRREVNKETTLHEESYPVAVADGYAHPVRFRIPPDAPFSYEGRIFSLVWSVAARDAAGVRGHRVQEQKLMVLP